MALAAQLIDKTTTSALVWNKVQYHWPDHIVPEQRNHLQLSLSQNIEVLKSKEMMQRLRRYEIGYDSLPCLYNAFVSVPLLHHIRELSGGKFFHCVSPDLYSSVALAAFVPQYLRCSFALTINGASRHSIGTAGILKRNDQSPAQKFENELKTRFHPLVPQAPVQSFGITDALLQAQTFLPGKSEFYQVDFNAAARSAAEQMRTWSPTAYKHGLEFLREFGRRNNIEAYVEQLIASTTNQPVAPADIRRNDGFNPENQLLTMDSSLLGIENVYDAGLICSYLMRRLSHQQLSELWPARRQIGHLHETGHVFFPAALAAADPFSHRREPVEI
jgi:hypothetical protein